MKPDAMIRRCSTAIGLAFTLALLVPNTRAQDAAPAAAPKNQKPTATATGPRIDIQISDGVFVVKGKKLPATIRNIVEFLNENEPGPNIVYSPAAGGVVVNDLTLKSVDAESFCRAVAVATDGAISGAYEKQVWGLATARTPDARRVEAFNLSGYLEHLGGNDETKVNAALEEVIQIIKETAFMLKKEGSTTADQFSVRYHRGANLLVVVGSPEAIDVARKVVEALPGQPSPGTFQTPAAPPPPPAVPRPPAAPRPGPVSPPGR